MIPLLALALLGAEPNVALPDGGSTALERVTLPQAVERALERNVSVMIARQEVLRAEALVEQARSASLPTLYGTGLYTRLDSARTEPNPAGGAPIVLAGQDQLAGNVTLTLPIVAPARWMQWIRAADQATSQQASYEDVRRTIAATTARAYLTLVASRRIIDADQRARDTAKAHLEYSSARLRGGVGTRLDEARAEQEWRSDEVSLQNALISLTRAREALGLLLSSSAPLDAADEGELSAPPTFDQAFQDAQTERADLKASQQRLRAAKRSAAGGWTDYLPLLSAVIDPFYQNPPEPTVPLHGWQAQLVLTIPFYDGGLRYGQQHEREALQREAQDSYDQLLRQTSAEVRVAFEAVRRADDALQSAREAASLAREALKLTTLAYQNGATTNIEVIDAERQARDAETSVAVAEDASRQERLELLLASGHFP